MTKKYKGYAGTFRGLDISTLRKPEKKKKELEKEIKKAHKMKNKGLKGGGKIGDFGSGVSMKGSTINYGD